MQTTVLNEVLAERQRQNLKWGEQNHPDIDRVITRQCHRMPKGTGTETPEALIAAFVACKYYEIPSEQRAKFLCNRATDAGNLTFAHILVEEVSEAVSAATCSAEALRAELIQVAAVAVSWAEAIDRRAGEMTIETRCEPQLAAIRAALIGIDDWAELVEMIDHFTYNECDCHIAQKIALRAARDRFDESTTGDWTDLANVAATVSQGEPLP